MSSVQKFLLAFLGTLALVLVSTLALSIYPILEAPGQKSIEQNCIRNELGECINYESAVQAWVSQTQSAISNTSSTILPSSTPQPALITFPITPTIIISEIPSSLPIETQTITQVIEVSPSDSGNSLTVDDWRDFPIIPEFSPNTWQILLAAVKNGQLDIHTFVKVGDCHMESGIFLSGYVEGSYRIPEGLENTVDWYSQSMRTDNITAVSGYGINTVLDPAYAFIKGHEQCLINETPLDCELRTKRPSIVLIAMGTNWIPNGEESFEKHLRVVVSRVLETGALPVLATKTDNLEGNWKINRAIAQVSIDYDIPLVNIWGAMQNLPNKGLRSDGFHLDGNGWLRNSSTWLKTLDIIYQIVSQEG